MSCPSQLRLDEWVADPGSASVAEHLPGCARCQARVARLREEREAFLARARPAAFADQVLQRRPRRRWIAPFALALAAAALLVLVRARPSHDEDAYKGDEPEARLYVRHDGALARYEPTRRYVAGDRVQIVVLSPRPVFVAVVDVEEGGEARVLYAGERALGPGRAPLPSSFELDGWSGGERFVVLFGETRIDDALGRARRGEGRSYVIKR